MARRRNCELETIQDRLRPSRLRLLALHGLTLDREIKLRSVYRVRRFKRVITFLPDFSSLQAAKYSQQRLSLCLAHGMRGRICSMALQVPVLSMGRQRLLQATQEQSA